MLWLTPRGTERLRPPASFVSTEKRGGSAAASSESVTRSGGEYAPTPNARWVDATRTRYVPPGWRRTPPNAPP